MSFLTKLQNIATALNDIQTAIGQIPAIQTALTDFNSFLDTL